MKYKISQHLLILYGLTEPSDSIDYSLYCNLSFLAYEKYDINMVE